MISFQTALNVVSRSVGLYVNGIYVDSIQPQRTIQATVQPAKNNDMLALPEGRRTSIAFKVYSETELVSLANAENPDIVIIDGAEFEVVTKNDWQLLGLPHFKYIVVKK